MSLRWLHLVDNAESLLGVVNDAGLADDEQVWRAIQESLDDLELVFPREIEPTTDLEGFAVRCHVRALLSAVERLQAHHPLSQRAAGRERPQGAQPRVPETIHITEKDQARIEEILSSLPDSWTTALLESELRRAKVVSSEQVPADVVTMNSRIRFQDVRRGSEREVTLVYPSAANPAAGRVSVLAPVGAALLGLAVGDEIDWLMPSGEERRLQVIAVPFQPEAAGQFDL